MAVITAPEHLTVKGPIIFLAGPTQGAEDWRRKATDIITKQDPKVNIANPRRESWSGNSFNEQVDWETKHLRMAGKNGIILFWLAKEQEHDCSMPFAKTTRFELAEWKVNFQNGKAKLAVGIEPGFSGADYIKRRFMQDCPGIKICSTLEETCLEALRQIQIT